MVEMTAWLLAFISLSIAFGASERCLPECKLYICETLRAHDDSTSYAIFESKNSNLYSLFFFYLICVASEHTSLGAQSHGEIIIQSSNNVLNQIESRIFKMYLNEELGYRNVSIRPTPLPSGKSDKWKIMQVLLSLQGPTLNLGVWMPADFHTMPPNVEMAGRLSTGYFGWFVPKRLIQPNDLPTMNLYTIFKYPNTSTFKQFVFDDEIIAEFGMGADQHYDFVPDQCVGKEQQCVTLLAAHRWQTEFVIKHINELKLYVKVKWLGANLQPATRHLYERFRQHHDGVFGPKFVVLHYSPSEVIDTDIEYETITMPACKDIVSSNETMCQYETMAVIKYMSEKLSGPDGINYALREINFDVAQEKWMLRRYQNYLKGTMNAVPMDEAEGTFDTVACDWLKENSVQWSKWIQKMPEKIVYIGGIFPNAHESTREHEGMQCAILQSPIILPEIYFFYRNS